MAIETAFEALQRTLDDLKGELEELRVNAVDFYPEIRGHRRQNGGKSEEAPPPPVVSLADQATDLEGELEEGLQAGRKACQAVRHPRNLAEAQMALAGVQSTLNRILRRLLMEVASYDTLQTLFHLGRQRGVDGRNGPQSLNQSPAIANSGRWMLLPRWRNAGRNWRTSWRPTRFRCRRRTSANRSGRTNPWLPRCKNLPEWQRGWDWRWRADWWRHDGWKLRNSSIAIQAT
jgi:hypothetical protein